MNKVIHFIEGEQVLTRAEILSAYKQLGTGTIQLFLEKNKPKSWVDHSNKFYYSKEEVEFYLRNK